MNAKRYTGTCALALVLLVITACGPAAVATNASPNEPAVSNPGPPVAPSTVADQTNGLRPPNDQPYDDTFFEDYLFKSE